jgi:hypothetical protein
MYHVYTAFDRVVVIEPDRGQRPLRDVNNVLCRLVTLIPQEVWDNPTAWMYSSVKGFYKAITVDLEDWHAFKAPERMALMREWDNAEFMYKNRAALLNFEITPLIIKEINDYEKDDLLGPILQEYFDILEHLTYDEVVESLKLKVMDTHHTMAYLLHARTRFLYCLNKEWDFPKAKKMVMDFYLKVEDTLRYDEDSGVQKEK